MDEDRIAVIGGVAAVVFFLAALFVSAYFDGVKQTDAIIKLVGDGANPLEASCAIRGK